jgi:hypothetical protein
MDKYTEKTEITEIIKEKETIEDQEKKTIEEKEQKGITDDDISFMCRFCNVKLIGGYDDKELIHCQYCHNIWDGNAQCNCWMNE